MAPGRARRNARCYNNAFAGFGEAFQFRNSRRAFHHIVEVMRVLGQHAMQAPGERQAPRRVRARRQRDDRRFGPLARRPQARRSGFVQLTMARACMVCVT